MFEPSPRALVSACIVAVAVGCSPASEAPAEAAAPAAAPAAEAEAAPLAARIGDAPLTVAEVDEWIKDALMRQATRDGDPSALHEIRTRAVDQIVSDRLLEAAARERGLDAEALLEEEASRRVQVDDAEVEQAFEANKEHLGELDPDDARARIREQLEAQQLEVARREYLASLREAANVAVLLEPPRTSVVAEGPSRGPADAPVTIVEFSDYQCPFCRRAEPTVKALLERYPEQIRFVFRHFPLEAIHPRARAAAEAAACAEEQGHFWPYHERLFQETLQFTDEDLEKVATELELDLAAFRACRAENRFRDRIEADLAAGREAGVSGTPAFFVNGIKLSGARPLDDFVEVVEAELAREGSGS